MLPWTCLGLALLLFPDGRLPSPGWRPVAWIVIVVFAWSNVTAVLGASLVWSHPFVSLCRVYTPARSGSLLFLAARRLRAVRAVGDSAVCQVHGEDACS